MTRARRRKQVRPLQRQEGGEVRIWRKEGATAAEIIKGRYDPYKGAGGTVVGIRERNLPVEDGATYKEEKVVRQLKLPQGQMRRG